MSKILKAKDVFAQIKADLIGKDSYRGVTLTYTWLANQFGHFSLGFIPSFILYLILSQCHTNAYANAHAPWYIWGGWIAFETYNFLGPLLLKSHSKSKLLYVKSNPYTFQPAWGNILFDTLTDLSFFGLGAMFLGFLGKGGETYEIVCVGLAILLLYPSCYWYLTKMYLQIPQYPYQLRLAQWDFPMDDAGKKTVADFLNPANSKMHLFVFGAENSGKTSLSVGLATELSIRHEAAVYTTAMKLSSDFFYSAGQIGSDPTPWTWRDASVLIIDDINPGKPITTPMVSAEAFLSFIDTYATNPENRKALASRKTIWVLGSSSEKESWRKMLLTIGVVENDIAEIYL